MEFIVQALSVKGLFGLCSPLISLPRVSPAKEYVVCVPQGTVTFKNILLSLRKRTWCLVCRRTFQVVISFFF